MRKLVYLFFIIAIITACSKDEENKSIEVDKAQLNQTVYADETQGKSGVSFTTTAAWTSSITETTTKSLKDNSTPENWVSVTPDRGDKAGNYTITINLTPNYTGAERSATITINCNGDKIEINVKQDGQTQTGEVPVGNDGVDVYVAGTEDGLACYWKNGEKVVLSNRVSEAKSIFVAGNDVYVAGGDLGDGNNRNGGYWKNGQHVSLSGWAESIFVSGNDIYVAGSSDNGACYWKNGVEIQLEGNDSRANSVFVAGNDVYIAGGSSYVDESVSGEFNYIQQACYWKNGKQVVLDESEHCRAATSVFVSGNDVYVAGRGYNKDKKVNVVRYWKNGHEVIVEEGDTDIGVTSLFVSGNDVYMSGYRLDKGSYLYVAKYWKNGQATVLSSLDPVDDPEAEANSIFVVDDDVYVAGDSYLGKDDYQRPVYWKNGKEIVLNHNSGRSYETTSIFVVKK
ncbi:BACON domain-containing protein [Dysgonomonas gadei]|uniref:BACON domain-containing protein n=1 Tax=Dysgonomonas gadei TaxID=156974 RepID=UPI003AF04D17